MWQKGSGIPDPNNLKFVVNRLVCVSGRTGNGTGPPYDHSTFSLIGKYAFIDSKTQHKDEKAHLISKPFQGNSEGGEPCIFSFWYFMHGQGVGKLNVFMR